MLPERGSVNKITFMLLQTYSFVNRAGLLRFKPVAALFNWSYFFYKRLIGDPYRDFVRKYPWLLADGFIVDVGANLGYNTLLFAKASGTRAKVFAFEPDGDNFRRLLWNTSAFKHKVFAAQAAVGSKTTSVQFWRNRDHHADHRVMTPTLAGSLPKNELGDTVSIKQHSLDDFFMSQTLDPQLLRFVKVDVQGYELEVMLGMVKTLQENPRVVVGFEVQEESLTANNVKVEDLLQFFTSRKYTLTVLGQGGRLEPLHTEDLKRQRQFGHFDVIAIPPEQMKSFGLTER